MPDFAISRSAPMRAAPLVGVGILLSAPQGGAIIHVLGHHAQDLKAKLDSLAGGREHAVRSLTVAQWLLVLPESLSMEGLARLQQVVGDAALVDQTHGRVRILVDGAKAEAVLSKGTAVDLHPQAFPVGRSAVTLFGHVAAHMTRISAQGFELLVLRGFAESLWDDLSSMAAEYL